METVTISANLDEIVKRLPTEKLAKRVMSRAINRGLTAGRVQAAREVAKDYTVRQRQVNEKTRIRKAAPSNLEATLTFSGPALNVADFKVSPSKPQPAKRRVLRVSVSKQRGPKPAKRPILRVTVSKSSGPRQFKGAFLIPVRAGKYRAFRRKGKERLPIQNVWGPSIPSLIGAERVRNAVQDRMQEVIFTRLDHEINRELSKGAGR